jgi:hypothetical protein
MDWFYKISIVIRRHPYSVVLYVARFIRVVQFVSKRRMDICGRDWGPAKAKEQVMVNMGVEPRTLALLAPRSKPTELIDRCLFMSPELCTRFM